VPQVKSKSFKYVDLFAGVGGFAAAINSVGGEFLLGAEIDPKAAQVYKLNFGHSPLNDVRKLASEASSIADFDLITGGFPCQPFSKSGAQLGTSEDRGTLFDEIAEIIRVKRPTVIFLENVKNLVGPKHIEEWYRIVEVLRNLGYRVSDLPAEFSPHLLPKSLGGRPQHRVRIFITATLNPDAEGRNDERPEPVIRLSDGNVQNWDLARDLPLDADVPRKYALSEEEETWLSAWDEILQRWNSRTSGKFPGFPIWSDNWSDSLPSDYETFPAWKKKFVDQNRNFYLADKQFLNNWLAKWEVRQKFPTTKRKFEWQAGTLQSVWDCLVQFRPSGIRLKRSDYIPTLVALNQTPIYGPLKRRLTEREVTRAQGFPEGYEFGDQPSASTYKQMGNAVNVGVIAHVFRLHCERDKDILSQTAAGRSILSAVSNAPQTPDSAFKAWKGKVANPNQ
jgi:DNA (cytosine-5)-methyltransferase 1